MAIFNQQLPGITKILLVAKPELGSIIDPAGRGLISDWYVSSFILAVFEKNCGRRLDRKFLLKKIFS